MGEYFEITFFSSKLINDDRNLKKLYEALNIKEGRNNICDHRISLFAHKEIYFEVFNESDYVEYQISILDLAFTRKNFDTILNQLLEVIACVFNSVSSIRFATGVYELTHYYTQNMEYLSDFDRAVFAKFPLVFFRSGDKFGLTPTRRYGNIFCVIHEGDGVQKIFANPIRTLMEDEGLGFEEAEKRQG